jgi:oligosaccharyltransferase complex subunit alpha (ribophorin I)
VYEGNVYPISAYKIKRAKTIVTLAPGKVESFTKVAPSDENDAKITYGAYDDVPALSLVNGMCARAHRLCLFQKPMRIHYENNTPFLAVTKIERVIEVSHWGNIAVEEYIEMEHVGARLRGPFSRYDFQREQRHDRQSSISAFKVRSVFVHMCTSHV